MDVQPQIATNYSLITGKVQIIEATLVSLDHTTVAMVVANPLTNDYQTSTSPLVGRDLSSFKREWLKENG